MDRKGRDNDTDINHGFVFCCIANNYIAVYCVACGLQRGLEDNGKLNGKSCVKGTSKLHLL